MRLICNQEMGRSSRSIGSVGWTGMVPAGSHKPDDVGSNPIPATNFEESLVSKGIAQGNIWPGMSWSAPSREINERRAIPYWQVAHLVEQHPDTVQVSGSKPLLPTYILRGMWYVKPRNM